MDWTAFRALLETHPTYATASDQDLLDWGSDPEGLTLDRERTPVDEIVAVVTVDDYQTSADRDQLQFLMQLFSDRGIDTKSPFSLKQQFVDGLKEPGESAFIALTFYQDSIFNNGGFYNIDLEKITYARTL